MIKQLINLFKNKKRHPKPSSNFKKLKNDENPFAFKTKEQEEAWRKTMQEIIANTKPISIEDFKKYENTMKQTAPILHDYFKTRNDRFLTPEEREKAMKAYLERIIEIIKKNL